MIFSTFFVSLKIHNEKLEMKTLLSLGRKCPLEMAMIHEIQTHGALFYNSDYLCIQISR